MNCTHWLIRRTGPQPPGYFSFRDPVTGMQFPGEGGIRDVAAKVAQHRLSNVGKFTHEQLDFDNIVDEIDCWTCIRLGNPKQFCTDGKIGSPQTVLRVSSQTCPECATLMTERLCQSCGGRKIVGYTCHKCGKDYDK